MFEYSRYSDFQNEAPHLPVHCSQHLLYRQIRDGVMTVWGLSVIIIFPSKLVSTHFILLLLCQPYKYTNILTIHFDSASVTTYEQLYSNTILCFYLHPTSSIQNKP